MLSKPSFCGQSATAPASSLTTPECSGNITPISSELISSKEQCQKLRDSVRKGKLVRRKLKLKVQQLENTNKRLIECECVCACFFICEERSLYILSKVEIYFE